MAQATFSSPIKKVYGETASLTTTASHLLYRPNYHEVMMYCASDWRMGLAPRLACVKLYTGTTYIDYTAEATDRNDTTHVPLDGMTTAKTVYLGTTDNARGFYFNVDVTNKNDNAATLDMEYCYDIAKAGYMKLTGTISGALTVGETVTGQTSANTATLVYSGATYIIVKDATGPFTLGEDVDGATQTCDDITAVAPETLLTPYFTDVASDSDGTDSAGDTLKQDGLYSFALPAGVRGAVTNLSSEPLYWYRFTPSATLSTTVDLIDIIPACDTTNYSYMQAGAIYQFSLNLAQNGAFEFDHTGTGTLNISWIMH